jgi:hypothetical protein
MVRADAERPADEERAGIAVVESDVDYTTGGHRLVWRLGVGDWELEVGDWKLELIVLFQQPVIPAES